MRVQLGLVVLLSSLALSKSFLFVGPLAAGRGINHKLRVNGYKTFASNRLDRFSSVLNCKQTEGEIFRARKDKDVNDKRKSTTSGYTGPGFRVVRCFAHLSRREADKIVAEGRVKVNGKVVSPSWRLNGGDVLTLDDKRIDWEKLAITNDDSNSNQLAGNYFIYNKPMGVTSTMDRNDRRSLANSLLPVMMKDDHNVKNTKLFPVGRLDADSAGLLLLTNNGRLADSMLQPSKGKEKEYIVVVSPRVNDTHLRELASGVNITTYQQRDPNVQNFGMTRPCLVERAREDYLKPVIHSKVFNDLQRVRSKRGRANDLLRFVIHEGRNRQIRKMCEALGYEVDFLLRVRFGDIQLGKLAVGEYRSLNDDEQARLIRTARAGR